MEAANLRSGFRTARLWACVALLFAAGCSPIDRPAPGKVPYPISLTLPKTIRLHPFTGTRTFDPAGAAGGLDVRIEALDSYNDPTKAFGDFRFELHEFVPNATDPKGRRLSTWDVSVVDPKTNLLHWDGITRTYQFKLKWVNPVPVGERFVLRAVFSSPHTDRLFDERVLVSGQ